MTRKLLAPLAILLAVALAACGDAPPGNDAAPPADAAPTTEPVTPPPAN